jgi:hypothetical protein
VGEEPEGGEGGGLRFFLLPVHVSLSFVQTPPLASALYLLLLRFLGREYREVMRLVNSVGTDTELTLEEGLVLDEISAVGDAHPDAHAARIHLSLALSDAPSSVKRRIKWDLPKETVSYLNKLSYVAMSSRLERDGEVSALEASILQIQMEDVIKKILMPMARKALERFLAYLFDPAFKTEISPQEKTRFDELLDQLESAIEEDLGFDTATIQRDELFNLIPIALNARRSTVERYTLHNREDWLSRDIGEISRQRSPQIKKSSRWQWWFGGPALAGEPQMWAQAEMNYARIKGMSGTQLMKLVMGIMSKFDNMMGENHGVGFLWLYEVF